MSRWRSTRSEARPRARPPVSRAASEECDRSRLEDEESSEGELEAQGLRVDGSEVLAPAVVKLSAMRLYRRPFHGTVTGVWTAGPLVDLRARTHEDFLFEKDGLDPHYALVLVCECCLGRRRNETEALSRARVSRCCVARVCFCLLGCPFWGFARKTRLLARWQARATHE